MAYRSRRSGKSDRKFFRDTAKKVKAINLSPAPMRGGIRL